MAAILKHGLTRDDPKRKHTEPQGDHEDFYLGRSIRGVHVAREQAVPISINGFTRYAIMGEDNTMERAFVDVLEQSASHATVPDMAEYDPEHVSVMTWGRARQKGTWAWWDECVDEVYAILPSEAIDSDFAPGFDIAMLKADLDIISNENP